MVKVNFINQSRIKNINLNQKNIKTKLKKAVNLLKIKSKLEINIIFNNEQQIRKLNFKYFKNKSVTDVISLKSQIPINNSVIIADIIICPQEALRNATKNSYSLNKEIQILTLHGLLHLTGLDHKKKSDQVKWKQIFKKLENIIK